jgi:hypothetical protein
MAFIVEMIHGKPGNADYQFFSCSGRNWEKVLSEAENYGWKPMKTVRESTKGTANPVYDNYSPCDWGDDYKVFLGEDALSLSQALDRMALDANGETDGQMPRPILLTDTMDKETFGRINRGLQPEFLRDFSNFLRRGDFIFCWDD